MTEHQDFFNAYGEAAGPKGHEVFHENFTDFILDQGNTFFCADVNFIKMPFLNDYSPVAKFGN